MEFFGDYWHGNPKLYKSDDIVSSCYLAKDIWQEDKERIEKFNKLGYSVMIVWEHDWKKDKEKVIEDISKWILSESN